MGKLYLLQKIDPDRILVTFARQPDLDEVADNAKLDHLAQIPPLVHRRSWVRRLGSFSAGNEVLLPDAPGHLGKGKCVQSPLHVSALITIGEPAYKKLIERRA